MGNYYSICRTNYFSVTDENGLKRIIAKCKGEDEVVLFQHDTDKSKFGFYCYGNLMGLSNIETYTDDTCEDDDDPSLDSLFEALQRILPDGEAIIITEAGNEKMRYITCLAFIITASEICCVDLAKEAVEKAREVLNNPNYKTEMEY